MNVQTAVKTSGKFAQLAEDESLEKAKKALEANGIEVVVVDSFDAAKEAVLSRIPEGSEVMTNASRTLDEIGVSAAINESGKYDAVRGKMMKLYGDPTKKRELRKIAAAPDFSLGSVQAVTEDGEVLIASASGSQLGQYPYAAGKVIWVAGTHKIVRDTAEGMRRIHEHAFPLENERAKAAYGFESHVSKILTIRREQPGRFTLVLIKEHVGF